MCKPMHCPSTDKKLPIGLCIVHFCNKVAYLRHGNMRVQGTVADEDLSLYRMLPGGMRRCERPVNTGDSLEIGAASREFEGGRSSKAIANHRDAAIDQRMVPQSIQAG